jgi:hypothetical protein
MLVVANIVCPSPSPLDRLPKWLYNLFLIERGTTMRYSHDYTRITFEDSEDCVALFEAEAAEHLVGLTADDVGAVVCYLDAGGVEQAYIDYELQVGSVYALTGLRSDELGE